jgi:hypothetical protein
MASAGAGWSAPRDSGWFRPRYRSSFELSSYWDTVADLKSDLESGRPGKHVDRPYPEIEAALREARANTDAKAQLRYRREMILHSYVRQ